MKKGRNTTTGNFRFAIADCRLPTLHRTTEIGNRKSQIGNYIMLLAYAHR